MASSYAFTRHAKDRSGVRAIPEMIAEIIIEYGESRDAGDGARKYALTKESMSLLRRRAGRELANAISLYRNRNAYVVACGGRIITVAYSNHPLFN
jgi:hypothetical protein